MRDYTRDVFKSTHNVVQKVNIANKSRLHLLKQIKAPLGQG